MPSHPHREPRPQPAPAPSRAWLTALLTGIAYYLGAQFGVKASIMSEGIAIFWPPNAILLTALLLSPPRRWPWHLLAIIPAEIAADVPTFSLGQALLFVATNIFETTLAASLLKFTIGLPFNLDRLRHVTLFALFTLVVASGLAALLGAAVYSSTTDGDVSYWANSRIWWFGDGLGLLIITPVLLGWLQPTSADHRLWLARSGLEAAVLAIATSLAGLWIFSQPAYLTGQFPASPILLLPPTIWAATRFGVRGAASINLIIATQAIYCTIDHRGPFVSQEQATNVLRLQEYIAALSLSSLALAALLQELRCRNEQLKIFERAIAAVNDGILIADAKLDDHPIVYANLGFENITGYKFDEVKGRNPRFLQTDSDPDQVDKIRAAMKQHREVRALLRNRRKDGSMFWCNAVIAPVRDENGEVSHFIGIQHDISELVATETELRATRDQLTQINQELEQRIEQRTEQLKQANRQLEQLAATDALTGAYNRRYFMKRLNDEFDRCLRYGRSLAVVALDIDYFKQINDRYGHVMGDRVLTELTRISIATLRPVDVFARFGGEEFIVLLPETSLDEAVNAAERLRIKIAAIRIDAGKSGEFGVTVSIGVAIRFSNETETEQLLERADRALYQAKAGGRNCVCVANHSPRLSSAL